MIDVDILLDEAKETLNECLRLGEFGQACFVQGFINSMNKLPTIEHITHWIPVDERLPDGSGEVLVTADYNGTLVVYSAWFNERYNVFDRIPPEHIVIAWKELPEPYEKGSEDT